MKLFIREIFCRAYLLTWKYPGSRVTPHIIFGLLNLKLRKKLELSSRFTGSLHILHFYLKDMSRKVCEIFFDAIERWDQ